MILNPRLLVLAALLASSGARAALPETGIPPVQSSSGGYALGFSADHRSGSVTFNAGDGAADSNTTSADVLVNGGPTDIQLSSSCVIDGAPAGTTVGALSTTDPNAGDTFTYSIVAGDATLFHIEGNQLKTAEVFGFAAKKIMVRSTDAGGLWTQKVFDVVPPAYVLWTRSDIGKASLWQVDPNQPTGSAQLKGSVPLFSHTGIGGPWQATSYTHVSATEGYVLWTRSDSGRAALWQIDPSQPTGPGQLKHSVVLYSASGLGAPWQATSYTHVSATEGYVLWTRSDIGKASLWQIDPSQPTGPDQLVRSALLFSNTGIGGPWQATSYTHVSATEGYVLWTRSDNGRAALWQIDPSQPTGPGQLKRSVLLYSASGVGASWQATSYKHVSATEGYVLWSRSDTGKASLWQIDPSLPTGPSQLTRSVMLYSTSGVGGGWLATSHYASEKNTNVVTPPPPPPAPPPPPDTTPDQFTFDDKTGVALNAQVDSDPITVAGIDAPSPITISCNPPCTGGAYSVNEGEFTSVDGTVVSGSTVRVRLVAPADFSTTATATLEIGGVSDAFDVTTVDSPPPPDPNPCEECHNGNPDYPLAPNVMGDGINAAGVTNSPKPYDDGTWGYNVNGHGANGSAPSTPLASFNPNATCTDCHDISQPSAGDGLHMNGILNTVEGKSNPSENTAHLRTDGLYPYIASAINEWDVQVGFDLACYMRCHQPAGILNYRHPIDLEPHPEAVLFGTHLTVANGESIVYPIDSALTTNASTAGNSFAPCISCHNPHGTSVVVEQGEPTNHMLRDIYTVTSTLCRSCHL